ncbi:MAG: methionine--tRNA ligase [Planctomycetota bacterium]|jgi:methionyl-tRNA synthetase
MPKNVIVTSALPYANGPIHFGHVVGAYLPADIYVRYRRMLGDQVHYVCGSDEHGVAITLKAEEAGQDYAAYVDHWHQVISKSLADLDIDFDIFSGTAHHRNPEHRALTQQFFLDLQEKGYLLEKTEEQYYSTASERFLPDRYISGKCYECGYEEARGDECPSCGKYLDAKKLIEPRSSLDGSVPELRPSKHWYLDLAKARDEWLQDWFAGKKGQWKVNVENFVLSELKGLRERPITRDLPWGVPVPVDGSEGKVLYVWFDAPIGYMSISKQYFAGRGETEKFEELWTSPDTELYHFIGKDNITFHAVVFPSILKGAGRDWILPENVPANEFFNLEGRKFNTSKGWFIPEDAVKGQFPVDALRYALCCMMPETADSEWTWQEFKSRVNDDLADNLGNFVSRSFRFIEKFFDGVIPASPELRPQDKELLASAKKAGEEFRAAMDAFGFRRAAASLMALGNAANRYYDSEQPWVSIKSDRDSCAVTMRLCCEMVHSMALLATAILPNTAATLLESLGLPKDSGNLATLGKLNLGEGEVKAAPLTRSLPKHKDSKGREKTALFPKVSDEFIAGQLEKLKTMADTDTGSEDGGTQEAVANIDFEQFTAVQMLCGTIESAEKHPKADRLLLLQINLGAETRQIVSGLAEHYAPEELPGRQVVVAANLAPRKLRGYESQGMVLTTETGEGKIRLLSPAEGTGNGCPVK